MGQGLQCIDFNESGNATAICGRLFQLTQEHLGRLRRTVYNEHAGQHQVVDLQQVGGIVIGVQAAFFGPGLGRTEIPLLQVKESPSSARARLMSSGKSDSKESWPP